MADDPDAGRHRRLPSRGAGSRTKAYKVKTCFPNPPLIDHLMEPGTNSTVWKSLPSYLSVFLDRCLIFFLSFLILNINKAYLISFHLFD